MSYTKSLPFLLDNLAEKSVIISAIEISAITNNSREVIQNTLFLAYKGAKADGRKYILNAIQKGANAICYEPSDDFVLPDIKIPCIAIKNLNIKQSKIAARFYDYPSTKIPVIGVTGTNGKTSVTHFIAQCLNHCGVIGTIGYGLSSKNIPSEAHAKAWAHSRAQGKNCVNEITSISLVKTPNTTPDGLQLQKIIVKLIKQGAQTIAMEVSSHALSQQRVNDVQFHIAVFTNLTQDHLDYHGTMEHYRDANELLLKNLSEAPACASAHERSEYLQNAVINIDDAAGKYFVHQYKNKLNIITYSLHDKNADITVLKYSPTQNGFDISIKTPWGNGDFYLPLIGEFNIYNVMAVLGVLGILKISFNAILKSLSQLKTVNGRMQLFQKNNHASVIVDYAHTPDALEKALQSVRAHCDGKLLCVFGCGGERDKTKRPIMGFIAGNLCDNVIITNDNPRSENPEMIAQGILAGAKIKNKFVIELDRAKAIAKAIQTAKKNDWILIAGKGHETEQIMGDKILHHSDGEVVLDQLELLK